MKQPRLACDAGERNWIEHVALRSPPRQNGRMGPNGMRKERNYTLLLSRNKRAHSWERKETRRSDTDEREKLTNGYTARHTRAKISLLSLFSSMQPLLRSSSRVNANETTGALVSHRGRCSGEYILCIRIPSFSTMSDSIAGYSPTSARQMPLTDAISSSNLTDHCAYRCVAQSFYAKIATLPRKKSSRRSYFRVYAIIRLPFARGNGSNRDVEAETWQ